MTREDTRIRTADGHLIPLYHWPCDNPRAIIHIAHGMSEHGLCYEDVATELHGHGFAVFAHDHRCHGQAIETGKLGQTSENDHFRRICDDMLLVNSTIRGHYPGKPFLLLGHSMGSFISQVFAQEHPGQVDALLLEGSNWAPPWFLKGGALIAQLECLRQGDHGQSDLVHALSFGRFNRYFKPVRTDFDWLSRDTAFVDRYIADPLCGFRCSNRYWAGMLGEVAEISRLNNIRRYGNNLPIYLFAGDRDPVGDMGKGVKKLGDMMRKAGCRNVTTRLYKDARHDILHETNRAEVMKDLLEWINPILNKEHAAC